MLEIEQRAEKRNIDKNRKAGEGMSRSLNNTYKYFPDLFVKELNVTFEITPSKRVYLKEKHTLKKVDTIILGHKISINYNNILINIKGIDRISNEWVYDLHYKGE